MYEFFPPSSFFTISQVLCCTLSIAAKKAVANVAEQVNSPEPPDEAVDRATKSGEPDCLPGELTEQVNACP